MDNIRDMFSLEGKIIVVTGGTRRYGFHMAEALAEAGGTLILTSRSKKRSQERAEQLRARGLKAHGYSLVQERDDSIEKFVKAVIKGHKRIDVLVNSARHIPTAITRKELDRSFSINSIGLILLTRRVVEEMKKSGGGNIINISSIYGLGGQDPSIYRKPETSLSWDYPITKGGTIIFTKQLATTLAKYHIRANCLSLGGLQEAGMDPYFLARYKKRTPLGRMATGKDVKGAAVFLASDASRYMTGANLVLDGGWSAW